MRRQGGEFGISHRQTDGQRNPRVSRDHIGSNAGNFPLLQQPFHQIHLWSSFPEGYKWLLLVGDAQRWRVIPYGQMQPPGT